MRGFKELQTIYKSERVTVYRGLREIDNFPVIIKTQTAEFPNPRDLTRIKYEYELSQKYPNLGIVPIFSLEKVGNGYNLIMEDVGGIPLLEYWESSLKSIPIFLELSIQITTILGNLHKNQIIHKDIKPANILVQKDSAKVYLIDLGLASLLQNEEQAPVHAEALEGTLSYISPEQTGRMNRIIDFRSDLYSLGITFYELLTGKVPFEFIEPIELVHAHIAISPTPPIEINPVIPKSISDLILKLLSKNAEDRYFSAIGLLEDLKLAKDLFLNKKQIHFTPGERESKGIFSIPQRLYGREVEVLFLLSAFQRIAESPEKIPDEGETEKFGGVKLVLVGGYSGVGKTSLINEVHKPILEKRGNFISGKFDQFKRNIPYASLIQALTSLIRQILTKKEKNLDKWKIRILQACGMDIILLYDILPELIHITGLQTPIEIQDKQEIEIRFHKTLLKLVGAFASIDHPLIIFLDDLQWADLPTLKFIELLTKSIEINHLLLLGAYRDNELDAIHPLTLLIKKLEAEKINFLKIILAPLMEFFIERMICDTLKKEVGLEFPSLVHNKTGGNPFFVRQFLKTLYDDNCITYKSETGWSYDIKKIENSNYTENVVELVATRIRSFSEDTQNILKIASCIGDRFSLKILSYVLEKSPKEILNSLKQSLIEGVLLPDNSLYRNIETAIEGESDYSKEEIVFRFLHDRVQQASYLLLTENEKIHYHVKIGKAFIELNYLQDSNEKIFEIVNNLNFGVNLPKSKEENDLLLDLNLKAGIKAGESFSYEVSNNYFQNGISLIHSNTPHEIVFKLHYEYLNSLYKSGMVQETANKIDDILSLCTTKFQKAMVFNLKLKCLTNLGEIDKSIDTCIKALKLFDIELKSNVTSRDVFVYYKSISKKLKIKSIDDLYFLDSMQDKEIEIVMVILMNASSSAYWKNPILGSIFSFIMVDFSLSYGNTYTSAFAYSIYGVFLASIGEYKTAYSYGQLGLKLSEKYPHNSTTFKIPLDLGSFIYNWVVHSKKSIELLMNAFNNNTNQKDFIFGSGIIANSYNLSFLIGTDFNKISEYYKSYLLYLKINQSKDYFYVYTYISQFIKILSDEKPIWLNFQNEEISEAEFIEIIESSEFKVGSYVFYTYKLFTEYLFGNLISCNQIVSNLKPLRNYGVSQLNYAQDIFFSSLFLLKYKSIELEDKNSETSIELNSYIKQLKIYAENNPSNFQHKYSLVMAEFNLLNKEFWSASILYDEAISSSVANEYILEAGLCCELAGKFYETVNRKKTALKIISDSHYYYSLCGAKAKANEILKKYPFINTINSEKSTSIHSSKTYTSYIGATKLDIESITKVTTALSAELKYESLLEKLLEILLENAGAQRGVLLLMQNDRLYIEAEGSVDKLKFKSYKKIPALDFKDIPLNVIQYCLRTNKSLIFENATQNSEFGENIFIQQNKILSLLCLPVLSKGKLLGLLYLENNITEGAFTKDRIEILNIIISQTAISIENARLYESLSISNKELELTNERATKAYLDLEASQKQLVQSDKMITLGTMVAGVAHEINTPLGAIKANSDNISYAIQSLIEKLNPNLSSISILDLQNIMKIIEIANYDNSAISSKESRAIRKKIILKLDSNGHKDTDILADQIMEMGLIDAFESGNEIFNHEEIFKYLNIASDLFGIRKKSNVIQNSANKVSKIVKSLKSFMHFDQSEEKKLSDLTEGMETVLIILHNKLKYGIEVIKNYGDVPQIPCFADELGQIWTNLIHNSIQAMGEKGTLQIDIERISHINVNFDIDKRNPNYRGEYISVSIQDSGPGIPIEIRSKIFQAFFTTKPAGEGSGLGLHIIGKILEKHGGALFLESEPGRTRFTVLIPVEP